MIFYLKKEKYYLIFLIKIKQKSTPLWLVILFKCACFGEPNSSLTIIISVSLLLQLPSICCSIISGQAVWDVRRHYLGGDNVISLSRPTVFQLSFYLCQYKSDFEDDNKLLNFENKMDCFDGEVGNKWLPINGLY